MVAAGGRAKGYSVKCEYILPTGAIVDVHLERKSDFQKGGAEKVAVEVAVISTPERELAHIRECLKAGYATVYTLFCDESLLQKTAALLGEIGEEEEKGRVRLLPVQRLALFSGT